ncbi:MAG TPA: response regulator [Longimicrobiales bacterium]|nr:response regulator [Longimicrobiales bacterium]
MRHNTILIVDDDADFAEALASFLEANGYRVLRAASGRDGMTLARLERPDLILMDVMMEERTEGFFRVQELRRTPGLDDIPIFVISSMYSIENFDIEPDPSWLGHDEFFRKPVDVPRLLRQINARLMPHHDRTATDPVLASGKEPVSP